MIERVGIADGDMITMAKLVNANTINMNNRIMDLEKFSKKQASVNGKAAIAVSLAIIGLYRIYRLNWRIKKLEDRVKDLEEAKEVEDFLK